MAWIGLGLAIAVWILIERSVCGRWLLASGQNLRAARLAGVPVEAVRAATYLAVAVFAALAGYLLASFSGGAALNMGAEYLLMSIAVVVIGGSSIAGGNSNVPGVWGAALFMFLVVSMLNSYGAGAGVRNVLTGDHYHRNRRRRQQPEGSLMINLPPHLQGLDPRFAALVHPLSKLERIAEGFTWTEGPVWFGDRDCLLFSDIPSRRVLRWSEAEGLSVYRSESGFNNGNTRDRQGRLVGCRHGERDVVRTEHDGSLTVLAQDWQGKRLNSPNDVVVSSDGAVWFTDPTYGILSNFEGFRAVPEQPARNVYRLSPEGVLSVVVSDFVQPNGLCFSPDESLLYIAESGSSHDADVPAVIRMFAVDGGTLTDLGVFAMIDHGLPDGMRCDMQGHLWSSARDGVHCFDPAGALLGKILVPETVSNLCFGGPDGAADVHHCHDMCLPHFRRCHGRGTLGARVAGPDGCLTLRRGRLTIVYRSRLSLHVALFSRISMKQACHHTSETALPATKQVVPFRSALLACCGTRRGEARVALARLLARPEHNRAVGGTTRPKAPRRCGLRHRHGKPRPGRP